MRLVVQANPNGAILSCGGLIAGRFVSQRRLLPRPDRGHVRPRQRLVSLVAQKKLLLKVVSILARLTKLALQDA